MSCLHISGTQRSGVDVPLRFYSPPVTKYTLLRLERDAASDNPLVRAAAASKFYAPGKILSNLAMDTSENVRVAVAKNPTSPTHVLQILSQDSSMVVRAHVAYNRNTPPAVIDVLRNDPDDHVKNMVGLIYGEE